MKIKRIVLNNVRSYENQEVEFNDGSTLLSGDIGSGKTSILLAIEFSLFGLQPGQRGSSLLRNNAESGSISIEFEIDEKNILIERSLKRGSKSISQDYAAITVDGDKTELSVTELKNKVLELLNYPKEFSKKQNILYKFTVYTPQEEMKQIILQDSESRINTLRHVFGIDKYKRILENSSFILSKIREEKRFKEAMIFNIEEEKQGLVLKESEVEILKKDIVSLESDFSAKKSFSEQSKKELEEVSEKINEKNRLQQEIEKTKIVVSNKEDLIFDNKKRIEQIVSQIEEFKRISFDGSMISSVDSELKFLKEKKRILDEKKLDVSSKISSLNMKNSDQQLLKQKITRLEVCPTCLQDVDSVYKSNVSNKIESDITENINKIKELEIEKQKIFSESGNLDYEISLKEKEIQGLKLLEVKLQTIGEKESHLENLKKQNISIEQDILLLKSHIDSLKSSVFGLLKYDNLFEEKKKLLEERLKEEKLSEIKLAELQKEKELLLKQIEEIKSKIKKSEEILAQLVYISKLEDWIVKQFIPVISFVEKNVLAKLKSEFSGLFSEWFSMLVSDNFHVRLDDDFTPLIEHQDYEIDYNYLSGGERTAIALAYRLALNQVINSLLSRIKTKGIVILDEPTDGFSSSQLDKMREVLDQLNVSQLIIVSHEHKIEGFVDNVIKFKKENGISCIAG